MKIKKLPDKESLKLYWKCIIYSYKRDNMTLSPSKWTLLKRMESEKRLNLNMCRGSGKTLLGSHFAVWRGIKYGEVIWAADSRGQLTEMFKHLHSNPFVKIFNDSINRQSVTLIDKTIIHTIALNEKAFLGKHVLTLILDEVARMDVTLINLIRKCLLKGGIELFLSTPVLGSFFQDLCNIYPTVTVTYLECQEWLDKDDIELQMKQFPSLKAMYLREYLCVFTALDGAIFPNIEFITQEQMNAMSRLCTNIRQGMDFNTNPGHVGARIGDYNNKTYVLETRIFPYGLNYNNLKTWLSSFKSEIEDGGANKSYQDEIGAINSNSIIHQAVPAQFWYNRIGLALMNPIVVVENSEIAKDLLSMMFVRNRVDMNPHHFVAAFLHAIGATMRYFEDTAITPLVIAERERDKIANRRMIKIDSPY